MVITFVPPLAGPLPLHSVRNREGWRTRPPAALPFHRRAAAPVIPATVACVPPRCSLAIPVAERAALLDAIAAVGPDRGIFGVESATRSRIDALAAALEAATPTAAPVEHLSDVVDGRWRLLYTTLTILGRRRSQLSLSTAAKSGFVALGELYQNVAAADAVAENVVQFRVLGRVEGAFSMTATYTPLSGTRVGVAATGSTLEPPGLAKMLGDNVGLLAKIFDPTGWLDITYVDDAYRLGRDDKGHLFVLEKLAADGGNGLEDAEGA